MILRDNVIFTSIKKNYNLVKTLTDQRRPAPIKDTGAPLLFRAASGRDSARDRQRPALPSREGRRAPRPQAREHSVRQPRQSLPGQDL